MNDEFEKNFIKKLITESRTHRKGGEEYTSVMIALPTYGFLKDRKQSKKLKSTDAVIWDMVEENRQLETRIKELENELKERTRLEGAQV
ncbi:hypothetical protein K8R14_02175 [bacterium]|nr:hypothetical protein [bacterium]